jgi:hypothetical protein
MAAKKIPYINKFNGNVIVVSKAHGKKLDEDWEKIEFVQNEAGENVMRLHLDGATVDVSENEPEKVGEDGIGSTK